MSGVPIVVKVPKDVAEGFDKFIEENLVVFGSRTNLMRSVLANIELLAKTNSNVVDPEKKELKKENEKLKLKLVEYEAEIYALKKSKKEIDNDKLINLSLLPKISETVKSIEAMVGASYFSEDVPLRNQSSIDSMSLDNENNSMFKSPKLR